MKLIVFEDAHYQSLLPLVYTRPVFKLRCGFDALLHKMEAAFGQQAAGVVVRPALRNAFHKRNERAVIGVDTATDDDDQLWINGRALVTAAFEIPRNSAVWRGEALLAARVDARTSSLLADAVSADAGAIRQALGVCRPADIDPAGARLIEYPWQLVNATPREIVRAFADVEPGSRGIIYPGAHLVNEGAIYIGAGSRLMPCAVLDADDGPIYIGDNVTIRPNVTITGPCFIGENCTIQAGANIREGTSIGMWSKIGGEVEGTIIHGYSNKQHDGFLGHSYVGEWVNLGADTVTSDLKNTYGSIRVPINGKLIDSGEMFVGAIIGDHTKTGINVALPTGCVIGFASNIFMSRYPPKFIPSFSWLTDDGAERNDPERALAVAHKVVARRKRELGEAEVALFLSVANLSREIESA
ncbi:MAG TPA: putative sugar nucleotidyl transferase [Phycisphaerae bacterium]|nr:putative sugar nucleotidyl transferase [Phycisphaerae bacterium]HRW51984.1 putative sugar nucleotidyl transferase [Phycisphaerae bacterium]